MNAITKQELIKKIYENSKYEIEPQDIEGEIQVAVWFSSFGKRWSICYQNGDMNGDRIGDAVFDNPGADEGLKEIRNILKEIPMFQHLIDRDTYWEYLDLDELINDFCKDFSEKHNISGYF